MPAPKAKLGAKWLSPTDIRATLTKIHANRNAHANLLQNLGRRLESHREQVAASLRGIDAKDRPSIVAKSVHGLRSEIVRESADQRLAHTRELGELAERVKSAATHYKSPVQMLMRETLGSERRGRIMQQITGSGPAELASLAEYAAATQDREMAAALCGRVADLPRAERPFSAAELANVMLGDLHRELAQALIEAERSVLEGLNQDVEFETGQPNPQRALQIAMLKKQERQIGAYVADDEDDDEADDESDAPLSEDTTDRIAAGLAARRAAGA